MLYYFFFFFSSRRRHTRFKCDWSSDVCSSDLGNDMVKTGAIGEFIAAGTSAASPFVAAAKRVAAAGWRAEVHSLGRRNTPASNPADFELEIMGFEAANADFPGVVRER